jgi:formylglycine-generating enzyme required for sulfatase activity
MATDLNSAGIGRAGSSGRYTYAVMDNDGSSANRPITYVSWLRAARFANWMANGQPSGAQDATTTEDGAYALNGATAGVAPRKNAVNPNTGSAPTFYVPLENEWSKAAYYSPARNDGAGGYYLYPTQSDATPGNAVGSDSNQANFFTVVFCVTQSPDYQAMTRNYLTDVRAFTTSPSFYGTYDQGGLVWQWNDLDGAPSVTRGLRGGAYTSTVPYLRSSYRTGYGADRFNPNGGFRLAAPAS